MTRGTGGGLGSADRKITDREMTTPAESGRPRLRRSLEFTERHTAGGTERIVSDPLPGRSFRGGELEAAWFARLEGGHRWLRSRRGAGSPIRGYCDAG